MDSITPYKISTITSTGSVNMDVNLEVLFESIKINSEGDVGVMYAEYGNQRKGKPKKTATSKRKVVETVSKRFDNQLTLEYKIPMAVGNTTLNCKIFRNGNVQMTGVKFIEQGHNFVDKIISVIDNAPDAVGEKQLLENKNYRVRMINCDYKVGFCIKRDALFRVMIHDYENMSSFEPCIYPGVKIQYMWNINNNAKDGICRCEDTCVHGKGDGMSKGKCKKITVAVFQSGCIIITGAQTKAQIDETYAWINNIIIENRHNIEKKAILMPSSSENENKKKVLIPRGKIVSLRPASLF